MVMVIHNMLVIWRGDEFGPVLYLLSFCLLGSEVGRNGSLVDGFIFEMYHEDLFLLECICVAATRELRLTYTATSSSQKTED